MIGITHTDILSQIDRLVAVSASSATLHAIVDLMSRRPFRRRPIPDASEPVAGAAPASPAPEPEAAAVPDPVVRRLSGVRAYLSGASLLVVGVLIGVLIAPGVRGEAAGPGRSAAVTHTTPATASGRAPGPSGTKVALPPTFAPGASPTPIPGVVPSFDPAQPVTVALGDSITFNADSWFRQICTGGVLLQNCLNAGIRGNTTTQMLTRIQTDALVYQPAVMFVMGGTNDLKRHEPTQEILGRLDKMIDQARAVGATAVICTIPPRNGKGYGRRVLELNMAIRRYATRGNVPLLDLYESVGTSKGVYRPGLTRDGIHPNLKASDLMTAAAEQQLPTLLHPVKDPAIVGRLAPNR